MASRVAGRICVTMPIYEYRCENDHRFELIQKFTDDAVSVCEVCGAAAQRVLHPVAIHFKGSGFYSTDYGRGKKAAASAEAKADSGSDSKSSSSDGAKAGGDSKSGESKSSGGDSKSGGDAKPAKAAEG
jgi:putative FmdB family regulatory protein